MRWAVTARSPGRCSRPRPTCICARPAARAGQTSEAKVFETFPNDGDLASIGWIQGVKAASEGRFTDADGWFQVALESGLQQQPPHAWSWVIESEWLQAERSLEVLEKAGEF